MKSNSIYSGSLVVHIRMEPYWSSSESHILWKVQKVHSNSNIKCASVKGDKLFSKVDREPQSCPPLMSTIEEW